MSDLEKRLDENIENILKQVEERFTTRDKYRLELEERMEKIEDNVNYARFEIQEQRLSELEKKPCMKITEIFTPTEVRMLKLTHKTIGDHTKQLTELRELIENRSKDGQRIIDEFEEQLTELKEASKECTEAHKITQLGILKFVGIQNNIREVLRKLGYDYVKHMKEEHTYIIPLNIEKSLEKLDAGSAQQTEEKPRVQIINGHVNFGEHIDGSEKKEPTPDLDALLHGIDPAFLKGSGGDLKERMIDYGVAGEKAEFILPDEKPPEPKCDNCWKKGNYDIFMCPTKEKCIPARDYSPRGPEEERVSLRDQEPRENEPKAFMRCGDGPEPRKKDEEVVEPSIDLWEKNTVTVVCPFCHKGYYLAPKSIEERLISEFVKRLKEMRDDRTFYSKVEIYIEEYEDKLK